MHILPKISRLLLLVHVVVFSQMLISCEMGEQIVEEEVEQVFSMEAEELRTILDEQESLIEDMAYSKESGDREGYYEILKAYLDLDSNYQSLFDSVESELTGAEANQISKRYQQLVRKLPRYK